MARITEPSGVDVADIATFAMSRIADPAIPSGTSRHLQCMQTQKVKLQCGGALIGLAAIFLLEERIARQFT